MSNAEKARLIERYEKWGKECVRLGIVGEAVKDTHFLAFEAGYNQSQRELLDKVMPVIEFYAANSEEVESSWMEPDSHVPYWTLWENGDCVGPEKARELLSELKKDKASHAYVS